jgi:hypothetical protein
MVKLIIDINDLRNNTGGEAVEDLAAFLKEKLGTEIDVSTSELSLETEKEKDKKMSRTYIRVLLKKFLHKTELKEDYHIIAGKENSLVIKQTKITEEEEE